ncbi:MAG: hypothetical protein LUG58_00995 [Clostridiales bacterium]|nr:hypothetical protein [Clostridiales bacterium]
MLFRKDIEPRCTYCRHGSALNEEQIACHKKGIVSPGYHCRRFAYDPLRRVPPARAQVDFSRFKDEDFEL